MPFIVPKPAILILTLGLILSRPDLLHAADRSAQEILAEIDAVKAPQIDSKDRNDSAKLRAYRSAVKKSQARKAVLIGELMDVDPSNPEVPKLAPLRWRTNIDTPAGTVATSAELNAILARNSEPKLVVEAAYFQTFLTLGKLGQQPRFEAMMPPIEAFISRFPDDLRCATLLSRAADRLKESDRKTDLLDRIKQTRTKSFDIRENAVKQEQADRIGKPFDLDFNDAIQGATVSMKQLKGKVVIIDFWATWCGPCIAEMPEMKRLYAEYHPQGVEFIGISLDQPTDQGGLEKLKKYVAENKIAWPQYYQGNGWESRFSTSWGIFSIPTMFLVDAEGNLASVDARGNLDKLLPEALKKAAR